MAGRSLLAVLFYVTVTSSFEAPLKWPVKYTAEGNIILPYADINEPFKAVVDMSSGLSSLNTYNGMTA